MLVQHNISKLEHSQSQSSGHWEDQDQRQFMVYNGIKYLQLEAGVEYYFALAAEDEDIVSNSLFQNQACNLI